MTEPSCSICGSTRVQKLYESFDYWYNRKNFKAIFYECKNCYLIFQSPIPPKEKIADLYPGEYITDTPKRGYLYELGLRNRCQVILNHKKYGKLLDIGCSTGEFIRAMHDWYNWEVTGIELDHQAAQIGITKHQLNIISGDFDNLDLSGHNYDVITLWDVLEHLPDPEKTISKIRTLLKSDGIVVIRVPNADSWDAKVFNQYWAGFDPPRHFYIFRKITLKNLLTRNGFIHQKVIGGMGSYLNFVKSVKFFLTAKQISPKFSKLILLGLSSIPARIISFPLIKLKDGFGYSSAMIIIAAK
jgi:SAM-dependent methyltransferase